MSNERRTPPIAAEAIDRALAPFGESTTLPAPAFTSDEVFAWEQRRFFEGSWVCLGRSTDVPEPGDRRAVDIGSEGVVLVRDEAGELRGFSNVCRHRGHQVVEPDGATNAPVIRCPYHAWVYGLDGRLKGAADFADVPSFEVGQYRLAPVRVAEWHGWVFVNASGDAPPFDEHVGNLEPLVAPYEPQRLVAAARHAYVVQANWKLITENYHECYHCSSIHPELCRVTPPTSGVTFEPDAAWVGGSMDLMDHAVTMSLTGESHGIMLRGLDRERRRQVLYLGLFPNVLISLHPDYVMTHVLTPLGPGRTRVVCEWLFAPEAAHRDGFDPSYAVEFWDITNKQDWHACESVQRGMASRAHRPGPLSPREEDVYQFITLVAKAYRDGGRVSKPRPLTPAVR
jgi:phenylpropionate dioxygenase-like ring-hydroxylating dioxygenase large terminal subunit